MVYLMMSQQKEETENKRGILKDFKKIMISADLSLFFCEMWIILVIQLQRFQDR